MEVIGLVLLCLPLAHNQLLQKSTTDDIVASGQALGGRDGPLLLEILLPFHSSFDHETRICKGFNPATAFQDMEAVRLAFELVDKSPLLGNLSLGFDIVDSCNNFNHVIEAAKFVTRFISQDSCAVENCGRFFPQERETGGGRTRRNIRNSIIGERGRKGIYTRLMIGITESDVVKAVEPILSEKKTAILSHMAASSRLDVLQKGRDSIYFYRVIPADRFEVKGLVALLEHFQWMHIAAFSSRTPDYTTMFSLLREQIGLQNNKESTFQPCLAIQGKFSKENTETMESAAKQLFTVRHIQVVLMLSSVNDTLAFFEAVNKHKGLMDRLVWLFSSKWGRELQQLPRGHASLPFLRRIKYGFFLEPVPASDHPEIGETWDTIEKRLKQRFQNLSPNANDETFNPWFARAWNASRGCKASLHGTQPDIGSGGNANFQDWSLCKDRPIFGSSLLLMEACFQAAHALSNIYRKDCPPEKDTPLCSRVRQVFSGDTNWQDVDIAVNNLPYKIRRQLLDETGHDPERALYRIKFIQPKSDKVDLINVIHLGQWSPAQNISLRDENNRIVSKVSNEVKSVCPLSCKAGERKSLDYVAYARHCCWKVCYPCTGRRVSRQNGSEKCEECSRGERPNGDHTDCKPFPLTNPADSASSVVVIVSASVGSILAILTIILFDKHRDTLIVKTADITLSTVMLSFQLLSFLSVALLLVEPSRNICISQVLLVLIWPVLYVGCILIKTNRLRVLFRRTGKLTKQRLLLLSNQTQVLLVVTLGILTGIFLIVWVVVSTPYRDIIYSTDSIDYTCHRSKTWMGVYFSGVLSLLLLSLVLSFQARNLPSDFNEASFLLLSTCSVTFLWIILIPAYYESTSIKPDTLLALIITGQGIVTLLCLFTRRLYYIVRPRSEEKMKSRKRFSKSLSRTKMTSISRGQSSASLRSQLSDHNRSSFAETQFGGNKGSGDAKLSSFAQHSKDFVSTIEAAPALATDEEQL